MSNPENILVVPAAVAVEALAVACENDPVTPSQPRFQPAPVEVLPLLHGEAVFVPRVTAEDDSSLKQLIVYALLSHGGKTLCYKRGKVGGEPRLHAKHSIGVGGHINPEDWPVGDSCSVAFQKALLRELEEEVGVTPDRIRRTEFIGLVNEDDTDVGKVHLGLVYIVEITNLEGLAFEAALVEPQWLSDEELYSHESLELWSSLIRDAAASAIDPDVGVTIAPYQSRVITERDQNAERLLKLTNFIEGDQFKELSVEAQELMVEQRGIMSDLDSVLSRRIAASET